MVKVLKNYKLLPSRKPANTFNRSITNPINLPVFSFLSVFALFCLISDKDITFLMLYTTKAQIIAQIVLFCFNGVKEFKTASTRRRRSERGLSARPQGVVCRRAIRLRCALKEDFQSGKGLNFSRNEEWRAGDRIGRKAVLRSVAEWTGLSNGRAKQ